MGRWPVTWSTNDPFHGTLAGHVVVAERGGSTASGHTCVLKCFPLDSAGRTNIFLYSYSRTYRVCYYNGHQYENGKPEWTSPRHRHKRLTELLKRHKVKGRTVCCKCMLRTVQ